MKENLIVVVAFLAPILLFLLIIVLLGETTSTMDKQETFLRDGCIVEQVKDWLGNVVSQEQMCP